MASMTTNFIAACLALIVIELAIMIAVFAMAMFKVRDAALAVEVASYRVEGEVSRLGQSLNSSWGTAVKSLFNVVLKVLS